MAALAPSPSPDEKDGSRKRMLPSSKRWHASFAFPLTAFASDFFLSLAFLLLDDLAFEGFAGFFFPESLARWAGWQVLIVDNVTGEQGKPHLSGRLWVH